MAVILAVVKSLVFLKYAFETRPGSKVETKGYKWVGNFPLLRLMTEPDPRSESYVRKNVKTMNNVQNNIRVYQHDALYSAYKNKRYTRVNTFY